MKAVNQIDLTIFEVEYRRLGHAHIAGIDEAGRGPLAGPVVAACVVLPEPFEIGGIDDSKKLTPKRREEEYTRLTQSHGVRIGIGIAESWEIDHVNILRATIRAFRRAIFQIGPPIDVIFLDGNPVKALSGHPQKAIVGGDAKSVSIAAASIIAKVTRDRLMVEYDQLYPGYGFASHKGYSAGIHFEALDKLGPCPIHRRSFAPITNAVQSQEIQLSLEMA